MKPVLKILAFLLGCMFVFLLVTGSSSNMLSKFEAYVPNPYRFGDLYMLSNMPGYRIKNSNLVKPIIKHKNQLTTLTIIGDSYTQHFDSSFFTSGSYNYIHWNAIPDTISIDKHKKNILIIESAERYIRWRLIKNPLLTIGLKSKTHNTESNTVKLLAEQNLQYMLTNFDWELPFKELKTTIHLNLFDRFSKTVAKPDGSGRLFLSETVDMDNTASSFINIPDTEVKDIVSNLNSLNRQLTQLGFDEVYISIIPNAATIYKHSDFPYNKLIERIQNDSTAHFKFIELLKPFKEQPYSVFLCNDSHWNELGKMIWLKRVNTIIDSISGDHTMQ